MRELGIGHWMTLFTVYYYYHCPLVNVLFLYATGWAIRVISKSMYRLTEVNCIQYASCTLSGTSLKTPWMISFQEMLSYRTRKLDPNKQTTLFVLKELLFGISYQNLFFSGKFIKFAPKVLCFWINFPTIIDIYLELNRGKEWKKCTYEDLLPWDSNSSINTHSYYIYAIPMGHARCSRSHCCHKFKFQEVASNQEQIAETEINEFKTMNEMNTDEEKYIFNTQIQKWNNNQHQTCNHIISYHFIVCMDNAHFTFENWRYGCKWCALCLLLHLKWNLLCITMIAQCETMHEHGKKESKKQKIKWTNG